MHNYPPETWHLVPLGCWNWKWNPARSHYSTYEQELLAGVLVIAAQSRIIHDLPLCWLCDQEATKHFVHLAQPPESKRRRRWWTFLPQFRLATAHIPGAKNEFLDFLSRTEANAKLGTDLEALAQSAFQRMDAQLDLSLPTHLTEKWSWGDYFREFPSELKTVSEAHPGLVEQIVWSRQGDLLYREDQVCIPNHQVPEFLRWVHESRGHIRGQRLVALFRRAVYTTLKNSEILRQLKYFQCHCAKATQNQQADRGLLRPLPIPYTANSLVYVDFIEGLPKFKGYDSILLLTCGLTRFCQAVPFRKASDGEAVLKIILSCWIKHYGVPETIRCDNDVRFVSPKGWHQGVLRKLGVKTEFGTPYGKHHNPLAERMNRSFEELMAPFRLKDPTKDWVKLVDLAIWTLNNQVLGSHGFTPSELVLPFRPFIFSTPFPSDCHPSVDTFVQQQQEKLEQAKQVLAKSRERATIKANKGRILAKYEVGEPVLVHCDGLPGWTRSNIDS